MVTVDPPARAVAPYPEYSVGTLTSGDYSSFDLTFETANLSSVPLVVRWKDTSGTTFSSVEDFDLRTVISSGSSTGSGSAAGQSGGPRQGGFFFGGGSGGGIAAFYPFIILVVVIVAGAVLWKERHRITRRKKKQ